MAVEALQSLAAARGVEQPHQRIPLAGLWHTTLEWPLLDVVAGVQIARGGLGSMLDVADRWSRDQLIEQAHAARLVRRGQIAVLTAASCVLDATARPDLRS